MTPELTAKVLRALKSRKGLDALVPERAEGRADLRGIQAPDPKVVRRIKLPFGIFGDLNDLNIFSNVGWRGLDFRGAKLRSFRFTDCEIEDAIFDDCDCRDWRLWSSRVTATSFRGANLRGAVLGPVLDGRRNIFREVCFDEADMRETVYASADFINCSFRNAKLDKVEFGGSRFVNCIFEGELSDVIFYRLGFGAESAPPNEMRDVDFRRASFRFVEFRGLDLHDVIWPESNDHIVIDRYPEAIDFVIAHFRKGTSDHARGFVGLFEIHGKWVGANQHRGIVSRSEIVEVAGETAWEELVAVLDEFRRTHPEPAA